MTCAFVLCLPFTATNSGDFGHRFRIPEEAGRLFWSKTAGDRSKATLVFINLKLFILSQISFHF